MITRTVQVQGGQHEEAVLRGALPTAGSEWGRGRRPAALSAAAATTGVQMRQLRACAWRRRVLAGRRLPARQRKQLPAGPRAAATSGLRAGGEAESRTGGTCAGGTTRALDSAMRATGLLVVARRAPRACAELYVCLSRLWQADDPSALYGAHAYPADQSHGKRTRATRPPRPPGLGHQAT